MMAGISARYMDFNHVGGLAQVPLMCGGSKAALFDKSRCETHHVKNLVLLDYPVK